MRRAPALLLVPLLAAVGLAAGCGSPAPKPKPNGASASVKVSGAFGSAPKVSIPKAAAGSSLYTKTLIPGSGTPVTPNQAFAGKEEIYLWKGTSSQQEAPYSQTLFVPTLLPGLATALKGAKVGSRVLAVVPASTFGSQTEQGLGLTSADTVVFVIDVTKKEGFSAVGKSVSSGGGSLPKVNSPAANTQPTITIPKSSAPGKTTATTLIKGAGPKLKANDLVLVQYTGVNWRTGKVFDSTYSRHQEFETVLTDNTQQQQSVIPGWVKGLTGQTVGSRVLLTIPPADGYGKQGSPQAGIKGTDTLVFVIDIIDAQPPTPPA